MANLVHTKHTVTTRTTIDHRTVTGQCHKAVGDRLHVHPAAITAPAHTRKALTTVTAKARVKAPIDPTIPKVKVRLGMIIVRRTMEKVIPQLKVGKVRVAGGVVTDMPPQLPLTQNYLTPQHYPMENNL